ncbi:hypothetical protein GUK21_31890 [Rhizobium leguminosarum]|uniref:hypothetical protein n=1 Tax=Rhizobium ruizarguesonis TaxID=2081791 RepID=UPI0013C7E2F3|nr:hypothetical protein [Rhizobium ruizarguesonis]NEJ60777.1 hypothetical protein [Rhizobium ruizarguesonis]
MKRYVVKFVELRKYEMLVDAFDQESAIQRAIRGPEFPMWINTELDHFEAEEIDGGAE